MDWRMMYRGFENLSDRLVDSTLMGKIVSGVLMHLIKLPQIGESVALTVPLVQLLSLTYSQFGMLNLT